MNRSAPAAPPGPPAQPASAGARRLRGSLGLIGVVLAIVLAAALLVQGRQLALSEQALRSDDSYGVLSLYQLELDYLRLARQWPVARGSGTEAPAQADLDELLLRYEVWVSRIDLARSPRLSRLMDGEPAHAAAMAPVQAFVARADPALRRRPIDPAELQALQAPLDALYPPLHGLTLAAAHRVAERTTAGNQALRQQSRLGVALSIFLCALCAAFAVLAMRQMRLLQQRQGALEELAGHLRAARREAEDANQAKSVFVAQISHEIRTPFQGLLGMLALVRESSLQPRQAEQLRIAADAADHLLTLLDDLLDLSLAESGRLPMNPAPLELRPLLRQIEALMRPLAAAKGLALHVDAEPDVPAWARCDATRVKQVLFNLLSNAIKFSDHGNVSLDLRLDLQAGSSRPPGLVFLVTDTGIGMDRPTAAGLFSHAAAGSAQVPPGPPGPDGHGLGLEISRQLARAMGGELTVRSVPGEGSRFRFELPWQRADAPPPGPGPDLDPVGTTGSAAASTRAAPRPAHGLQGPGRALCVLVAEDHPVNRQYLASLLEGLQHSAHFVADGRAAVQAMASPHDPPFDLVLMDLHMPELDGVGATRAIRALPDRAAATVPIIALTADAYPATRDRCVVVGMNDFLSKPVSPRDLAAALRRLFGHEAAAVDAPAEPVAAVAADTTELIDHGALAAALQGIPADRLSTLITTYLDDGPQTVARLRTAVRDAEPLELRRHAHAARGAALNLGLAALAETARALHDGAAHLPAHEVAHLVQRFEDLLPRTRLAARDAGLLRSRTS